MKVGEGEGKRKRKEEGKKSFPRCSFYQNLENASSPVASRERRILGRILFYGIWEKASRTLQSNDRNACETPRQGKG